MASRMNRAELDREMQRRAGCVYLAYARATGALVGIYQTGPAALDTDAGKYAAVCETHGTMLYGATLAYIRHHAPAVDWCEQCMAASSATEYDPAQAPTRAARGHADIPPSYPVAQSPRYGRNQDTYPCHGNEYPCLVCGKPCNPGGGTAIWLHCYSTGPTGVEVVTETEHATRQARGEGAYDLGAYPIGRECLKRYPALRAYAGR